MYRSVVMHPCRVMMSNVRRQRGGDRSDKCKREKCSPGFDVNNWDLDGRVYEGFAEFLGSKVWHAKKEEEFLDRVWLNVNIYPERGIGGYLPPGFGIIRY